MEQNLSFGWCFIGSGSITWRVMRDLSRYSRTSRIVSVYSPNPAHAQKLADAYGAKAFATAEEAMTAEGVDGVYVAAPHIHHAAHAERALRLGKPVLCEKPLTPNARLTAQLVSVARETGVYLAEAMWTRYNPVIRKAAAWVKEGRIGRVTCVEGDFGYIMDYDPAERLFQAGEAGGGILDVGIYPLAFMQMIYGDVKPSKVLALGERTPSGVDGTCGMLLQYPCGGLGMLFTALRSQTPQMAKICGEDGVILVDAPFWKPKSALLQAAGEERFSIEAGDYEGYHFEFDGVVEEILAGEKESRVISLESSRVIAEVMDEARRQLGVRYPFD